MTYTVNRRPPINTIRWWWVVLAAVLTALAAWAATWWLLSVAGHSADLRVQAIKAGLTVAAGTGGAAALLLATRRQWLQERDQAHREETDQANHLHQERLAAITELDATERRITDLYTKAVDQLGSEKAPVRLGGLYALERLAQDNPNQRQTIVNVICAYLRMPYTLSTGHASAAPNLPPAGRDGREQSEATASKPALRTTDANAREELQVRLTAQRILATHLKPNGESMRQIGSGHRPDNYSQFWEGICIDLTGATLVNFDFRACSILSIECSGATFVDGANFTQATFVTDANFSDARFSPNDKGIGDPAADFSGVTFKGSADFVGAKFTDRADFSDIVFEDKTNFCAHFSYATFAKSTFKVDAWFVAAEFTESVSFHGATFCGPADFTEATFTKERLGEPVSFAKATFTSDPVLYGAIVVKKSESQMPAISGSPWPSGWNTVLAKNNTEYLIREPTLPGAAE